MDVKDIDGTALKVGNNVQIVKAPSHEVQHIGKIFTVTGLGYETEDTHAYIEITPKLLGSSILVAKYVKKLEDLNDDELLENNILFSTGTDNWERISDYPAEPKLEPELVPA